MGRLRLQAVALSGCLLIGASAQAVPVYYDFVGTGSVCTYQTTYCQTTYQGEFTGTISIDVLADGPGPDGTVTSTDALDENGWTLSHFVIQWGDNSFSPSAFPGSQSAYTTYVANDLWDYQDELRNEESYYQNWDSGTHTSYARLDRISYDLSWLSGLTFETQGLAPSFQDMLAINAIDFADYTYDWTVGYSGFAGHIDLSSLTVRPTEVPEPATLSLFGIALAGLGLIHRRRLMRYVSV